MRDELFSGKDVREALEAAAAALCVPEDQIRYVVLNAGTPGGRGLSATPARIAVLLDKPAGRVTQVRADYVGFTVPDRWVVGYGLDCEGLYRNLPYVSYID